MRILLIEDNADLAELVTNGLAAEAFVVDHCATIDAADEHLTCADYDIVVLDLGLPDGDGMTLVRSLRAGGNSVPILIITARDTLDARLIGLDGGGDDYLIKPFATAELAARCRALLRRPGACLGVTLTFGNVALDTTKHEIVIAGDRVSSPPREMLLLESLLRQAGRVVPRERLLNSLYALDQQVTPNALDAAVSRLRKTLERARANVQLTTVYGIGYALFRTGGDV